MVRKILVSKEKNFEKQNIEIVVNDYTTNFKTLNYWNTEKDLDGFETKKVLENIEKSIEKLRKDNVVSKKITKQEIEYGILPEWWFGTRRIGKSIFTTFLKDEERKTILMFHLENFKEYFRHFPKHYFFLEN